MYFKDVRRSKKVSTDNVWCERHKTNKPGRLYLKRQPLKHLLGVPDYTPTVVYKNNNVQIKPSSGEEVCCGDEGCAFTTTSPAGLLTHWFADHSCYANIRERIEDGEASFIDAEKTVEPR